MLLALRETINDELFPDPLMKYRSLYLLEAADGEYSVNGSAKRKMFYEYDNI